MHGLSRPVKFYVLMGIANDFLLKLEKVIRTKLLPF